MAKLKIAATKSNLLGLRRQLAFAEEGYDLLEQKRQILIFELVSRLGRARDAERDVGESLSRAFEALHHAELDIGSAAIDQAALGVVTDWEVSLSDQHLMGMKIPRVTLRSEPGGVQYGLGGTSVNTDIAMDRFTELLPLLAQLAELQNAVLRLAHELRKTQRRCNALSKIFIPDYRETIGYIVGALEERERESFVILKMIRDRLSRDTEIQRTS